MAKVIVINIINWEKYQPRKDIKNPTWFALSNRIVEHSDFYSFSGEEFKAFIYILCQASVRNNPEVRIDFEHADRVSKIKHRTLTLTINKLVELQVIEIYVRDPYAEVRLDVQIPHATDKTDKTLQDKTDTTEHPADEVSVLFNYWNSLVTNPQLSKVRELSESRKAKIRLRLKEAAISEWRFAMDEIGKCPFLLGDNDRGWRADFDWFISNDQNRIKIIEGKYARSLKQKSTAEKNFDVIADQARRVKEGTL